ncbi:MAG: pilus assembly protein PilM [Candidatus Pacebacteria bacterium]|nr:pilus assembly protein PilM [Candidatus Paceibacterota bacterium]
MFSFINNNKKNTGSIGIDIGTKSIRIIESVKKNDKVFLENYGEMNLDVAGTKSFRWFDQNTLNPDIKNISGAILAILEESEIKPGKAVFSLPDFSTFFITFNMPPMSKKELDSAVAFEARKYIPIPMAEIVIDWQLIGNNDTTKTENKILVMAIPKVVINQYKTIADSCGLELVALEAEVLGLKRALIKEGDPATCLIEIGYQSTNISIVSDGCVITSVSYDIAGKDLTFSLAETLGIEIAEAEELKKKHGLGDNQEVSDILVEVLALICDKVKKIIKEFEAKEGKKITRVLLSGGTTRMHGLLNFFRIIFSEEEYFRNTQVLIGDAFYKINYYPALEGNLRDLNSYFSIAIGEGLKKFEK